MLDPPVFRYEDGVSAHDLAKALLQMPDLVVRISVPSEHGSRDVGRVNFGTYGDFMAIFLTTTTINAKGKQ